MTDSASTIPVPVVAGIPLRVDLPVTCNGAAAMVAVAPSLGALAITFDDDPTRSLHWVLVSEVKPVPVPKRPHRAFVAHPSLGTC